jgi:hypothetical protein
LRQPTRLATQASGVAPASVPRFEAAKIHESAVDSARAEPAGAQEHHRHERGGAAHADDDPADDQVGGIGRVSDPDRADDGKQRHGRDGAPRAEAVEPQADRQLHREQREEEGAARPADLPGAEVEVSRQLGRDHGVGDAVELTEAGDGDQQRHHRQFRRHWPGAYHGAGALSFGVDRSMERQPPSGIGVLCWRRPGRECRSAFEARMTRTSAAS